MNRRLPYSGRYTVQLDAKNRVILPALLRKLADQEDASGDFYLTTYTTGCLHLYTAAGFQQRLDTMRENMEAIEDDDEYDEAELAFQRFLHDSTPLRINEQGRLLLPAELGDAAGLTKNEPVHIVGSDEVIELWSADNYSARFDRHESDPVRRDKMLRKLGRRRPKRNSDDTAASA